MLLFYIFFLWNAGLGFFQDFYIDGIPSYI